MLLTAQECYTYNEFVNKYQMYIYPLIGNKIVSRILTGNEESVVDLGTGPGYLTLYLAENTNAKIQAVDINNTMLEMVKELINSRTNDKDVSYEIEDVHSLTYENNSKDAIISYSCLHHWVEPVLALKECYRVIKPGGKIIIIDTHPKSLLAMKDLEQFVESKYLNILEEAFLESYTPKHISEMVERAGIKNYKITDLTFSAEEFIEVIDDIDEVPINNNENAVSPESWILVIEKI